MFITTSVPTLVRIRERTWDVGRLLTPRMRTGLRSMLDAGLPWAADNDGFRGVHVPRYMRMLSDIAGVKGCRFVTAPDVREDAAATDAEFGRWEPIIHACDLPVAYVLQDGLRSVPWDSCEAVFIGGSTRFKLGGKVEAVAREARERGKWVHMGRVNTPERIAYARHIGCDSVDGSKWGRWPDTSLAQLAGALNHQQQRMASA